MKIETHKASVAVALFIVLCGGKAALAKDTWLPNFSSTKHVHVDTALTNHATEPFDLDQDFRHKLDQLSKKSGLDVYVVASQAGGDLSSNSKRWAPELLHSKLWSKWSNSSGFDEKNSVVILWIRGGDTNKMSTGVRVGDNLHSAGLSRNRLFASNGPVMSAISSHMPDEPAQCFVQIVENINAKVGDKFVDSAKAEAGAEQEDDGGAFVLTCILIVVVCGAGFFLLWLICSWLFGSNNRNGRSGGSSGSDGGGGFFFWGGCSSCSSGGGGGGCGGGGCGGGGCGGGGCGS